MKNEDSRLSTLILPKQQTYARTTHTDLLLLLRYVFQYSKSKVSPPPKCSNENLSFKLSWSMANFLVISLWFLYDHWLKWLYGWCETSPKGARKLCLRSDFLVLLPPLITSTQFLPWGLTFRWRIAPDLRYAFSES